MWVCVYIIFACVCVRECLRLCICVCVSVMRAVMDGCVTHWSSIATVPCIWRAIPAGIHFTTGLWLVLRLSQPVVCLVCVYLWMSVFSRVVLMVTQCDVVRCDVIVEVVACATKPCACFHDACFGVMHWALSVSDSLQHMCLLLCCVSCHLMPSEKKGVLAPQQ